MKIAINSDTRKVLSWGGELISGLSMTRRDVFPVELKFIQGAGYVDLPDGSTGQLALKGELAAVTLAFERAARAYCRSCSMKVARDVDTRKAGELTIEGAICR